MKSPDQEYMQMMRAGRIVNRESLRKERASSWHLITAVIGAAVLILLVFALNSFADEVPQPEDVCGCTRESDDQVCKAYYELKDVGFDVKVTCEKK